jgi:hypothetical protein
MLQMQRVQFVTHVIAPAALVIALLHVVADVSLTNILYKALTVMLISVVTLYWCFTLLLTVG